MKKIFNFALYDFANSAFTTIIITFIFATYETQRRTRLRQCRERLCGLPLG